MTNDELERQAFESWIQTKFNPILRRDDKGDYLSVYVQIRWEVWQARAKQESNWRQTISELRQLIEKQGGYNHAALEEEQKNDS